MQKADGVLIDGALASLTLSPLENNPDNQFAFIQWEDENDKEWPFSVTFAEGKNSMVRVHGDVVVLIDTEGDPAEFSLLKTMTLERGFMDNEI